METLLNKTRYVAVIGVFALLVASIGAFGWAGLKTITALNSILASYGQDDYITTALIQVIDSVLIASVLLVSAASIYEIFIAKLSLPSGMTAHNLYELKSKLSNIVVLAMALKFLEHLVEWKDASNTLLFGISIAVVSVALIALNYLSRQEA
jgi:uncharacterized membrane protein YqhA